MTIEYLLAMVGPGLLGGALAYFVWAKIDARSGKSADAARKTETPPVTTADAVATAPAPQELPTVQGSPTLVLQQTEIPPAQDGVERPSGADASTIEQTSVAQQDNGALEALRSDVAELATSLLSVHETMTQKTAQDVDQAPAFKDLTERLDQLSVQVTKGQAPDRIAAAIIAHLPETPGPSLPDAFATLPARVDQLANALTTALGNLPEDMRRAIAENPAKGPDLSPLEGQLEALSASILDRDASAIEGLKSDIAGVLAKPENGNTDAAALPDALADLRQDIADLASAQTPAADPLVLERLDAMEAKIDSLATPETTDIEGLLIERLAQFEENLQRATPEPEDIGTRLTALEDRTVAALSGLGEAMKTALSTQSEPTGSEASAALQDRIERISAAVTGIGGRLDGIEGLDNRLADLEAALKEEIRDAALFSRSASTEQASIQDDTGPNASDAARDTSPDEDIEEAVMTTEPEAEEELALSDPNEGVAPDDEHAEQSTTTEEEDPFADILSALARR